MAAMRFQRIVTVGVYILFLWRVLFVDSAAVVRVSGQQMALSRWVTSYLTLSAKFRVR